ncbi:DsbA family protein [Luminiphilus sp.]|nr:DsbA family protein [Luminiphilus sp.]MDB2313192.1 DsbA family protein [Luminiphilus sp.]
MIIAYIDFKSLDCYLALDPLVALAQDCNVTIDWRPFVSRERALPTQVDDEYVTRAHQRTRAESELKLQAHYTSLRGLNVTPQRCHVDTDQALARLSRIEGDQTEFVVRCFDAHWRAQQDINNAEWLDKTVADCGLSLRESSIDLDVLQAEAEEAGLFDAPTCVIDGQLFMGRAHLPLMRRLLEAAPHTTDST